MTDSNIPDKETLDEWQRDPKYWVFGVLYFNPKDKRIFPPKRIPMFGWTVNFANPFSVLFLLSIMIVIALIAAKS